MGTSLESVNALKSRALEVALSPAEANALETNGITSLARLAFAACHPGKTMHPSHLQALKGMPESNNRNSDLQGCDLEVKKSVATPLTTSHSLCWRKIASLWTREVPN